MNRVEAPKNHFNGKCRQISVIGTQTNKMIGNVGVPLVQFMAVTTDEWYYTFYLLNEWINYPLLIEFSCAQTMNKSNFGVCLLIDMTHTHTHFL